VFSQPFRERLGFGGAYVPGSFSCAQLEAGVFDPHHDDLSATPLHVSRQSFNLGFKVEARVAPGKMLFGLLDSRAQARWFGSPVGQYAIAATRDAIDLSTKGSASFYSVVIDGSALHRDGMVSPDVITLLENLPDVGLANAPLHVTPLRESIRRLFSLVRHRHGALLPRGLPLAVVGGTLVPLLADTVGGFRSNAVEPSRSLTRRVRAVRTCEGYMREHVDATVTLLDLSTACGVRSRSLINAFQAVTGFTPMEYLKRLRLNGVRDSLRRSENARTRIIDVATAWGFWHMGHFAADYRGLFGESPSQTLLKVRRRHGAVA